MGVESFPLFLRTKNTHIHVHVKADCIWIKSLSCSVFVCVLCRYDRSTLKVLGTVGEPINPEAWLWYYNVVGNKQCAIVDTFWQTETVSIRSLPDTHTPHPLVPCPYTHLTPTAPSPYTPPPPMLHPHTHTSPPCSTPIHTLHPYFSTIPPHFY